VPDVRNSRYFFTTLVTIAKVDGRDHLQEKTLQKVLTSVEERHRSARPQPFYAVLACRDKYKTPGEKQNAKS
jgi:hypothetical protein